MNKDFSQIPANACTFMGEIELGDNGDNAKTAPIRMLARSSQPIEHWYWGNVVHDISGFNLNGKSRLPIDFDHDTGQAIGYANRFEQTPEGLVMSGTIVSHGGDRAEKIMKDMRAGIPYEASINFGGDGIEVEEVPVGSTAQVNGFEFSDGVIVRQWPLRGVAVTLYGADMNTASNVFSEGTSFSAHIVKPETEALAMPKTEETTGVEGKEPVELSQVEAAEEQTEATELSQAVEEEAAEVVEGGESAAATVEAVEAEAEQVEQVQFSQADIVKMTTEFGADIAMQVMTNGGNYEDARALHQEAKDAELEALRKEVAELKASKKEDAGASPVAFADGESRKTKLSFREAIAAKARGEL